MYGRCANPSCLAPRHPDDGKLFRLDVEIGDSAGGHQHKTAYVWLCSRCAQLLAPKVQVDGGTVRLLLASIPDKPHRHSSHPC